MAADTRAVCGGGIGAVKYFILRRCCAVRKPMNLRNSVIAVTLLALLVPGARAASPAAPDATAASKTPQVVLKQGQPAEAVRQAFGKPDGIKPMKAPNGKAEIWVYVKEISVRVDRVGLPTADTVIYSQTPDGGMRQTITPGEIQFHDTRYVTEEITEVLMFNDHYVAQKVTRRERQSYQ